ncbi:MAG: excinuclease ABC subunit C [Spirochaeta sp. LUC14_002_19_P3]|nr:MAG: excinuclease ABC subunit C [Spirochaeta sp. LUC14_002_19_P3]
MTDKTTTAETAVDLKARAAAFPAAPGVYMFRDSRGRIIYVGKAVSLKARASSYFSGEKDIKTSFLVKKAANIEAILTQSEYEALVLENTLIKKHSPRYNINLKDGKSYPVIKISAEQFPRVFRTRRIIRDGSEYYGPYPNVKAVDVYIDLIHRLYPLRRCKILRRREKPCLYHHIERCPAPCTGAVDEAEYGKHIRRIKNLLAGRSGTFRRELEKQMRAAADELNFEHAAKLRDALKSLEMVDSETALMDFQEKSRDYIDFAASGRYVVFAVMQMRGGKVIDRQIFSSEYAGTPAEALPEFLLQYYSESGRERPESLLLSTPPDPLIERFFSENDGVCPQILMPESKRDKSIAAMVQQNAGAELDRIIKEEGDIPALQELKSLLLLPKVPRRIEGFDIAQLHGKHAAASLISFLDGKPDKAGYRHYRIRSTGGAIDDFKSIAEAVARRYQRLVNENKTLPDLILVDGGRGQVSSALKILKLLELDEKISLIGLAKREEEIWLPHSSEPVRLPAGHPSLRILQHVRDETHRFATTHSRRLRSKDLILSTLESVPGIGPSKSAKLLTSYKSLDGIYQHSIEDIAKTAGIADSVAETVHEFLGRTLESREKAKEARE